MNSIEMGEVLERLSDLTAIVYANEAFWHVERMQLMPPATERDIDSLSKSHPFPLPPSYRQFLKLSDGCIAFWAKFFLAGAKGEPNEVVKSKIEDAKQFQSEFAAGPDGEVTAESIAEYEASDEDNFFLPNHTVFGTNKGGEFLLFNEKVQAANGEYEVIHYTYDGGIERRYPDFPSFLLATERRLIDRIAEKGYASKKTSAAKSKKQ